MLQEDATKNDAEVALSRLIVVHEELRGARVVHVLSEVDVYTSAEFEREVAWAFSDGLLVVNLLDCRYADSTAIEVLLRAHKRIGASLRVVVPRDGALRLVCDVLKLSKVMFVVSSVEEAIKPLLCGAPEQRYRPQNTARGRE